MSNCGGDGGGGGVVEGIWGPEADTFYFMKTQFWPPYMPKNIMTPPPPPRL